MTRCAWMAGLVLAAALTAGSASASNTNVALGDVAPPPASSGLDRAALEAAAIGELRGVDVSKLRAHRNVVLSVAVIGSSNEPFACEVNAVLRDAKTGTMLAVLGGRAQAYGSATPNLRQNVLRAALRSAMGQIPAALAAKRN